MSVSLVNEIFRESREFIIHKIRTLDGDLSLHKGKVALKLATSQLEIFGKQFKEKLISKQELMRQIKPYLMLQVDAKKLIY